MLQFRYEVNIGFDGKSVMRYYLNHKKISFFTNKFRFWTEASLKHTI